MNRRKFLLNFFLWILSFIFGYRIGENGSTIISDKDKNLLPGEMGILNKQLAEVERKISGFYNVKNFLCDDGQYVKGDGLHDDTTGIQRALDNARGSLFFPKGIYRITGTDEACLYLKNNLDIIGLSKRDSVIRADSIGNETSVIKIAIENNFGFQDVRNWQFKNISVVINGGGKHSLLIKGGMQMLTCNIENNDLTGNLNNDGYGIYIKDNFAHSKISLNTFNSIYLNCYDANLIEKNIFMNSKVAVTFDLINGVRNNTVRDNTIVNRDGAVHIINGDVIRITNNQIELAQGQGVSESPTRSMIWIQGVKRTCKNIVIEDNNFGGGTSLDYLIYIDNAQKAVISKNNFISTNLAEVFFTEKSSYCVLKQDNLTNSTLPNPRTRTTFKAKVVDNGIGNVGVLKDGTLLKHQNNWKGGNFYKDENGMVHFYSTLNGGATASGTIFGILPEGFRPSDDLRLPFACSDGLGVVQVSTDGVIKAVTSVPSNLGVTIQSFPSGTTE
ncbi:hypothetical protein L2D08_01840 [Domibacillus sp. PGB-M46]|uniref:right-handed parallel beta-helix repeat-containing protein n=1 Tax=Domibacillus sp. PGB-M46 TaxID=2910255 RepID=UPI001F58AED2|nr:right-handed parallel beta-helix repeat-containing protein [Domibacillus sp. PGB-M46]MCI2253101.1 hypothetical protein [Domibacillus sp. PGB-M46]